MEGKFIVIDGTDGSGKTTQTKFLVEKLKEKNYKIKETEFPQYNQKSAGLIEEYLSGKYGKADEVNPCISSIFYACDRYDASFKIRKWLNEGKIVISNRYVSSNMGHQSAKFKNEEERKKYLEWLYDLEYNIFKIPKPDLNIILHVASEISQKLSLDRKREDWHGKEKDIHEEDLKHLKAAEKTYLEIANNFSDFTLIECVENGKIMPRDKIAEMIWQKVKEIL